MINNSPNMGKQQIYKELPSPGELEKTINYCDIHRYIYKAVFICVKLLLDIRLNLVMISEGKKIQTKHKTFNKKKTNVSNAVIKETDKIK